MSMLRARLIESASRGWLCAAALALASPLAAALSLGEIEVRSALGEPLDARIPLSVEEGEALDATCFVLGREGEATLPRLLAATLTLERSGAGEVLRVRSLLPIREPAVALRIVARCPGQAQHARDYALLLDPPRGAPQLLTFPATASQMAAMPGDTLASLAAAIFPGQRLARRQYLKALREANPTLASQGEREPIPAGTLVALPDLRTFASGGALAEAGPSPPRAPRDKAPGVMPKVAAQRAPIAESAPRATGPAPPPLARPRASAPDKAPRVAAATPSARSPGFVLKLSSPEVDLSRSRSIDDRKRAQLRERQLMLDADDQVAAMLALRHSVQQLEARVADLQLKLSGMPAALSAPRAPEPATARPAASPSAPPAPPKVAVVERPAAPKAAPMPLPLAAPSAPEPAAGVVATPSASVAPAAPALASAPTPSPPKKSASEANAPIAPTPSPPERSASETKAPSAAPQAQSAPPPPAPESGAAPLSHASLSDWLWALVALFVALALWLAWRLWRRQPARPQESEYEFAPALSADQIAAASPIFAEEPFEAPEPERRVIASDADLATRIPEDDAGDLRRRYIEERFPEIAKRTITIDDPDSVVKAARLFYEDGALPRAVELLQFAIEQRPGEVKTWLALFEIFRLERLTGQFAELAQRFREHHGKTEYWRKVQYIGREIEPGNSLYVDEAAPGLETIGSGAASGAPAAATFDPVTENWLNAPMDFQNEVLANELRKALMLEASLSEQDLIPNPMPALRNVEMFSVA